MPSTPRFLGLPEVAMLSHHSWWQVYADMTAGKIGDVERQGHHWFVPLESARAYAAAHRPGTAKATSAAPAKGR
jgi:hypothetical protein